MHFERIDPLDKMNSKILDCLKQNSRMSWREIGNKVHLTGQAVATRVKQMEESGVISAYTIEQDSVPKHFITVFMDTNDFMGFEQFLNVQQLVIRAYKITGDGCYFLTCAGNNKELDEFLGDLLKFGRYKVSSTLKRVK